ncbi:MAG: hypothetical protein H0U59_06075 [Gemmatimonadaceae bacterium]|nr:hypothetical protein [Gemmatimonadaceae bacterium]
MNDANTVSPVVGSEGLALNTQAVASQISAVEKSSAQSVDSIRREQALAVSVLDTHIAGITTQIELEKESIRRELAHMVKFTEASSFEHWRSHESMHIAQDRSDDAANEALEKRLGILNNDKIQIREILSSVATRESVDLALQAANRSIESEKADTRRRFETLEAKIHELEKNLSKDIQVESRPGQDLRTSQGTIIAAIGIMATILGVIVVVMNLVSGP